MTDTTTPEDATVTFHVKSAGGSKFTLTLPLSTTTVDLKNKLASEEYANVPAASQRLIYSGKVLKDTDTLASHNVKEGNTMHLVKSAASNQRQNPPSQPSSDPQSTSTPQSTGVPQTFAAGTGNDPLAGLTGARYAGFAGLPNIEALQHPPSQEDMIRQLQDPNFAQMMRESLNNPQLVDLMINSSPELRAMGPQARQILQSEQFRQMMTNPDMLRQMMQMRQMIGGPGMGMGGGQEAFPAPGETNTTNQADGQPNTQQTQQQLNPLAALMGAGGNPFAPFGAPNQNTMTPTPQTPSSTNTENTSNNSANTQQQQQQQFQNPNPFNMLLNPAFFGGQQQAGLGQPNTGANTDNSQPPNPWANNPYMQNPQALQNLMQMLGGAGGGSSAPPDNRPPEERYATQLRQLNEMGFHDFDRNIQALSRSGGDVNGALEWLFSQPS